MRTLANCSIKPDAQAFLLRLEDQNGEVVEFIVSAEQLDDLIDEMDELLDDDDTEPEQA